jgi:predicted Zn-dependent protease with MMP-like domain
MRLNWERLHGLAVAVVGHTLAALPAPLAARARALPITFERRPDRDQLRDGVEPDTLGMFIGPEFADEESAEVPLPPQIILYLENVWGQAEAKEDVFQAEVRTTLLHELGHYLGLNEDELIERGLE